MCYAHVIRNCRKRPFSSNNNKKLNFKKEWLGAHCNWFEGAAIYTASTNNGQEGHNAVIKRKITLRRIPAMYGANGQRRIYAILQKPNLNKELFGSAAKVIAQDYKSFKAKQQPNSAFLLFSIPSSACVNMSEQYYKIFV